MVQGLDGLQGPAVQSASREPMSPTEVIPDEEQRTVVLVPDGTLSFMRPIVNDSERIIGYEVVWMEQTAGGIWLGKGDVSGDLYVHAGYYKDQLAAARVKAAAEREAYWAGVKEGNRPINRLRSLFWRLVWKLGGAQRPTGPGSR